ncbi:hypothetical protein PAAG_11506 [Paracoccidioides lutzii Pb01]|uniref:Uncharacterized protein n=1 Tax=Paracoccidioides lutzii (strain ATCC MYA-826 / Pb01) TaxID=502779 RepID=A0A0A2V2S7_PARBA|nr:hypothetical protein PAAG_11506 [Paracoccidioides lutzii Pb01]KGQ01783.1 hypothetical protein PAAG_11506 [Paracoccidioides lutzii Pb01]
MRDMAGCLTKCGTSWTIGPNWPRYVEINIIEGINQQTGNSVALHAVPECALDNEGSFMGRIAIHGCAILQSPRTSQSGNPDPKTWPEPMAYFEDGCDGDLPTKHVCNRRFSTSHSVAGLIAPGMQSGVPEHQICWEFVQKNAAEFKEAYWKVSYVKIYREISVLTNRLLNTVPMLHQLLLPSQSGEGSRYKWHHMDAVTD